VGTVLHPLSTPRNDEPSRSLLLTKGALGKKNRMRRAMQPPSSQWASARPYLTQRYRKG
jgi:hypothetical protein